MRTKFVPLYAIVILGLGCLPRSLWAQVSPSVQSFNQLFDARFSGNARWDAPPDAFADAWRLLDNAAIEELDRSGSWAEVMRVFSALHGYRGPALDTVLAAKGDPKLSSRLQRNRGYFIQPLPGKPRRVVAAYELWYSLPGRLTIFEESKGHWRRAASLDREQPIDAYPLSVNGADLLLLLIDKFGYADREEGRVSLWKMNASSLARDREVGTFMDWGVRVENGSARFAHYESPGNLMVSFTGPRLGYETRIVARSGTVTVSQVCVTPWLETVVRYYSLATSSSELAYWRLLQLLHDAGLQRQLPPDAADLQDSSGDVRKGAGAVVFRSDAGIYRLQVKRDRDGEWRIQAVTLER